MLSATSVPTVDTQYPTEAESFPPRNELLYYVQLIKCAVLSIATLKCKSSWFQTFILRYVSTDNQVVIIRGVLYQNAA